MVAVSGEMEAYLRARNPAVRVRTIPNGVSADISVEATHPLRARPGPASGPERVPIIGSAGRLVPMKNHAMLIRAYAAVRKTVPCRLIIIGRRAVAVLPGSSCGANSFPTNPWASSPSRADVLDWVADMDVFVMPSNDGEGLPMALLEAGLLERAVVCTDSGGIPEVVHDWLTGRLIRMGDLDALIEALEDLLLSPENRTAFGKALRREVLADHDIRTTHGLYLEAYEDVLSENRVRHGD